jgi:carboxynorspermidine decarboxylase
MEKGQNQTIMEGIDYAQPRFPSPAFVLDEKRLRANLQLMKRVQEEAGVDIILAFKGFALWHAFPLVRQYLKGATASSLFEARLCFEEMKSKAHTYCVAYREEEFEEILSRSSHLTFNSLSQFERFKERVKAYPEPVSMGLRVNPGWSDVDTDLYNPTSPQSRLGIEQLSELPSEVEGLHFHALCESSAESLEKVLASFEARFGHLLSGLKWVNMGGGHLMTRQGYEVDRLIQSLKKFREKYDLQVILEPGGAVAWQTGELLATVLDIVEAGGVKTAILDVSFTNHMPDTLEMPYRPRILGATDPVEGKPTYRLGGLSCLAGDFMSPYSFDQELTAGDRLVFLDMIHYTIVKTTMFNGLAHPALAILREGGDLEVVRKFGYEDYKGRMG